MSGEKNVKRINIGLRS